MRLIGHAGHSNLTGHTKRHSRSTTKKQTPTKPNLQFLRSLVSQKTRTSRSIPCIALVFLHLTHINRSIAVYFPLHTPCHHLLASTTNLLDFQILPRYQKRQPQWQSSCLSPHRHRRQNRPCCYLLFPKLVTASCI
jgi:hypothetical protein